MHGTRDDNTGSKESPHLRTYNYFSNIFIHPKNCAAAVNCLRF